MGVVDKKFLRKACRPTWSGTGAWLLLLALGLGLLGVLGLVLARGPLWLVPPLVLLLAHLMHGNLIAFHEASHGNLCPVRPLNEAFGVFLGTLSFISLSLYRHVHRTHHAHLGTERDEELWPFVNPRAPRWARRLAAALELTAGLVYTPLLFLRAFVRRGTTARAPALRRRIGAELALIVAFWSGALTLVANWGAGKFLLVVYVVPAILAGNMQSLRKYAEHMGMIGATVKGTTRSVVPQRPLGRLLARSLLNEPYHGVHHRYARLPGDRLPAFAPVLAPDHEDEAAPFPSYWHALWPMLRSLADPRVGRQWIDPR